MAESTRKKKSSAATFAARLTPASRDMSIAYSLAEDLKRGSLEIIENVRRLVDPALAGEIDACFKLLTETVQRRGTIWLCGVGSSACDAYHIAADLVGMTDGIGAPVRAAVLGSCPSTLSCLSNQYGQEFAAAGELYTMARRSDCLWILTAEQVQDDVLTLARTAKEDIGMPIITFTDYPGAPLSFFGTSKVRIKGVGEFEAARVQEMHVLIYHTICRRLKAISANIKPNAEKFS